MEQSNINNFHLLYKSGVGTYHKVLLDESEVRIIGAYVQDLMVKQGKTIEVDKKPFIVEKEYTERLNVNVQKK